MRGKLSFTLLPILAVIFIISCDSTTTTPGSAAVYFAWWDGEPPASYEPLVIAVAPLGGEFTAEEYPNVPFPQNREEYLAEIADCYEAGAVMAHILPVAGAPDTLGSLFDWTWDNYKYIIDYLVENCPGMLISADISESFSSLEDSLEAYTPVNFVTPILGRYLYDGVWIGSDSPASTAAWVSGWQSGGLKVLPFIVSPQQADFLVRSLVQSEYLQYPYHFPIAIGWEDNSASTVEVFNTVINTLPDTAKFIVVCTGENPNELMGLAIADGHHIRVGLKDAVYWPSGTYSPISSTAFMVQKAVELANQMNRSVATTSEAAVLMDAYR
ncbi:MAG: 3-keto-5-aminohexanoate cleavage protein [candidate division Zixibacteria bacterium]|nr:3-keto-5-aminohexanoate cleavage protein [Candidatus Tariuqbacter arcticus]